MPGEPLLILGASTRAAACSALRAGFRPRCLDLFADADLAAVAPVDRVDPDRDADRLVGLLDDSPEASWIYTGSIETRADLVGRLSRHGRLLGNGPHVLGRIRDPWRVTEALRAAGLRAPAVRRAEEGPSGEGRWLVKSTATAGGLGVSWASQDFASLDPRLYLQEFIEGPTYSGLFVAARGRSRLLGISRQHQGVPGLPFLYRGGVGPIQLGAETESEVRRIGEALASAFDLAGLFGVDFILNRDRPWAVEVNPRYTASVELFELSASVSLMRRHVRACLHGEVGDEVGPLAGPAVGKRVVYATRRGAFPSVAVPSWLPDAPYAILPIADVPHAGTIFEAGDPILTVMAGAPTAEEVIVRLDLQEEAWLDRLA